MSVLCPPPTERGNEKKLLIPVARGNNSASPSQVVARGGETFREKEQMTENELKVTPQIMGITLLQAQANVRKGLKGS